MTFYNQVAERIAAQFPDRYVSGYVYQDFEELPLDPDFRVHPNVFLVWAPLSNYGFTHFRPEQRQSWDNMLQGWSGLTRNLAYYDLLNMLHQPGVAAPLPVGADNLKRTLPALRRQGVRGVYLHGCPAWGVQGPLNYVLARLSWNPDQDIDDLMDDFFNHAYGEGGEAMRRLYAVLDERMAALYRDDARLGYRLTDAHYRQVYAPVWGEMETLYREAEAGVDAGSQRERLELFQANMIALARLLRGLGLIELETSSPFYLPEAEFPEWAAGWKDSIYVRIPAGADRSGEAANLAAKAPAFIEDSAAGHPAALEDDRKLQLRGSHHLKPAPFPPSPSATRSCALTHRSGARDRRSFRCIRKVPRRSRTGRCCRRTWKSPDCHKVGCLCPPGLLIPSCSSTAGAMRSVEPLPRGGRCGRGPPQPYWCTRASASGRARTAPR